MDTFTMRNDGSRRRRHSSEEREFRVLVALTFPIFLLLVLTNSLTGKRLSAQGHAGRLSIFAEAKAAASTAIAIGFMG